MELPHVISTRFKGLLNSRKKAASLSMLILVSILAFATYRYAPIVKIGSNSVTYTYADIEECRSFSKKVSSITRLKGHFQPADRSSIYQSLVLAGIQYEILSARKIPHLDQGKAIDSVLSQSAISGLLQEERERIGDERFYKIFVLPLLSGKDFLAYYIGKDAKRADADAAFKAALAGGLQAAAEKMAAKPLRIGIPVTPETAQLATEARKSIGSLLPKIIEDNNSYMIIQPAEVTDSQVIADAVILPRIPLSEFILSELEQLKVPVKDRIYSWFRVNDLKKPGRILGDVISGKAVRGAGQ